QHLAGGPAHQDRPERQQRHLLRLPDGTPHERLVVEVGEGRRCCFRRWEARPGQMLDQPRSQRAAQAARDEATKEPTPTTPTGWFVMPAHGDPPHRGRTSVPRAGSCSRFLTTSPSPETPAPCARRGRPVLGGPPCMLLSPA